MSITGISIISHSDHVERLLTPWRERIGHDFEGYRGHIYRVLTYAMHFLNGDEHDRHIVETALVYHDLGLWSDRELAYLEPSMELVAKHNRQESKILDVGLVKDIIFYHHKITPYRGPNARIINAVRKADWIDATMGIMSKGMPRRHIRAVKEKIPANGFYRTLLRLGPELTENHFFEMIGKFMKVYKL